MRKQIKIMLAVLIFLLIVLAVIVVFRIRRPEEEKSGEKAPPVRTEEGKAPEEQDPAEEEEEEQAGEVPETEEAQAENVGEESADASPAQGNVQELTGRLEQLVSTEYTAGGSVAVCAGRADGAELAASGGGAMQAASLIKLYVAGTVYENYGTVSAQETYSGETESLLRSMITVSDNTACNTLVTRLGSGTAGNGMGLVNQYCASHGFSDTHMGRLMLQPNDADDNYTSVRDCCNFLKMALAGQLQGSDSILGYMNQQERRGKIPAGIPSGVTVGNKTGELDDVENDAAVVYAPGGTYVICAMSENLANPGAARQFIVRASGVVYEMMQ